MFMSELAPMILTSEKYSCTPSDNIQQKMARRKKCSKAAKAIQLVYNKNGNRNQIKAVTSIIFFLNPLVLMVMMV